MRRSGGDAEVAPTAPLDPPADGASDDWTDLLGGVKTMLLRLMVAEGSGSLSQPRGHEAPVGGTADVGACIAALDHLQQALRCERRQRRQLEREVSETRAALANARAALVGTRAEERRARYLALHDSLTSLPNRRSFLERLDQALRSVTPRRPGLAVIYIDLDQFKPVNDAHGHVTGDELLRIIAARLSRAVRAADGMSRLGGDEFGCIVADLPTRKQLSELVHKLIDAVSAPVTVGDRVLTVHPSIGIATYPADGASAEALLKSADTAMYHAKRHRVGFAFGRQATRPRRESASREQLGRELLDSLE